MNKSLEYYSCHQIREGFVISRSNEICCCCKNYDKETVITRLPDNPSQKDYKELIPKIINFQLNLIESHKKDLLPNICRECPELCKKQWKEDFSFTWILLAHFKNCNLRCPHCTFLTSDKREINTPDSVAISLVKYIYDNYADKQLFNICIGGGEPSVNLKLSELYKYALKNRIPVLILSNGAKFVPEIATGLKENLFSIILSPDAGSKEVFLAVKGVDYFNRTWETINDYSSLGSNNVSVKFILEYGNLSDIENMISKCVDCHVKDVILSFNCYLLNKCDLTDFKIAARKFAKLCSENSLNLSVPLGYVPIELYEETLIKYDRPFISAISEIKGDVYFWGASAFLRNFLSRKKLSSNLSIKGVIDQDNGKNLTKVEHLTVFSKEILNKLTNSTTIVIAVTHHQEEIKASIEKLLKEADLSNVKVITWL